MDMAMKLSIAKQYAEREEYGHALKYMWEAIDEVPEDVNVGWGFSYYNKEKDVGEAATRVEGFTGYANPIEGINQALYDMNAGVREFRITPGVGDD